jgi:hypothetical protein
VHGAEKMTAGWRASFRVFSDNKPVYDVLARR